MVSIIRGICVPSKPKETAYSKEGTGKRESEGQTERFKMKEISNKKDVTCGETFDTTGEPDVGTAAVESVELHIR
jgi:hypothetical protein